MTVFAELEAIVSADTSQFDNAMTSIGNTISGIGASIGVFGSALYAVGMGSLTLFGGAAVKAAAAGQDATTLLINSYDNVSKSLTQTSSTYDHYIQTQNGGVKEIKNLTGEVTRQTEALELENAELANHIGSQKGVQDAIAKTTFLLSYYKQELANVSGTHKEFVAGHQTMAKSMGISLQALEDLSYALEKNTRFSHNEVQEVESVILRFNGASADTPKFTKTILDLATAMGVDAHTAAIKLGEAYKNPAAELSKLQAIGVIFSAQQTQQIKDFTKNGDAVSAMNIIMEQLTKTFGGASEAMGSTFNGKLTILGNLVNTVLQGVGDKLLPTLSKFLDFLINIAGQTTSMDFTPVLEFFAKLAATGATIALIGSAFLAVGLAISAVGLAVGLLLSPFAIVIAFLAGMAIEFAKNFDNIRNKVVEVIGIISGQISNVTNDIKNFIDILTGQNLVMSPKFENTHHKTAGDQDQTDQPEQKTKLNLHPDVQFRGTEGQTIFDRLKTAIAEVAPQFTEDVKDIIKNAISNALQIKVSDLSVSTITGALLTIFRNGFNDMVSDLKTAATGAISRALGIKPEDLSLKTVADSLLGSFVNFLFLASLELNVLKPKVIKLIGDALGIKPEDVSLSTIATALFNGFRTALENAFAPLKDRIIAIIGNALNISPSDVSVSTVITSLTNSFTTALANLAITVKAILTDAISKALNIKPEDLSLGTIAASILTLFRTGLDNIVEDLKKAAKDALAKALGIKPEDLSLKTVADSLLTSFNNFLFMASFQLFLLRPHVLKLIGDALGIKPEDVSFSTIATALFNKFRDALIDAFAPLKDKIISLIGTALNIAPSDVSVSTVITSLSNSFTTALANFVLNLKISVTAALSKALDIKPEDLSLTTVGIKILNGLVTAISSGADAVATLIFTAIVNSLSVLAKTIFTTQASDAIKVAVVQALANVSVALTGNDVGIFKSIIGYIDVNKGTLSDSLKDKIYLVLNDAMKIAPGSVSIDAIKKEFVDVFGKLGDSVKKSLDILSTADWIGAIRTIVLVVVGVLLPIADAAGKIISAGLPLVATGVKTLIDAIAAAGQGDFGKAVTVIVANMPQVVLALLGLNLLSGGAILKIAEGIGAMGATALPALAKALPGLAALITPVTDALGLFWVAASPVVVPIGAIALSIGLIYGYFSGNKVIVQGVNDVRDALMKLDPVRGIIDGIADGLQFQLTNAIIKLMTILSGFISDLRDVENSFGIHSADKAADDAAGALASLQALQDRTAHDIAVRAGGGQLPYGDGVRAPVAPAVPSTVVPTIPFGGNSGQSIGSQSMAAQSAANTHNTTIQSIIIQQSQKSAKDTFDDIINEARSRGVNLGF